MKSTGIIRRVDELGRVVIPKEVRRTMKMREGEPLEIYTDYARGEIVLKKYESDELAPMGESIVMALRKNGIKASVYNADGDRVAGSGAYDIDTDLDDECMFKMTNFTDGYADIIGYVVTDVTPSKEDTLIIDSVIDLSTAYLTR